MSRFQLVFIGGAFALHLGAWVLMGAMPKPHKQSTVAIALAEAKKKQEEKKKPPPPHAPDKPAARTRNVSPSPKPAQPEAPPPPATAAPVSSPVAGDAPASMDGFAELGLSMSGGGSGMSVPVGNPNVGAGGPRAAAVVTTQKVKQLTATDPACVEDIVKPKLEHHVQPGYTAEAQEANVEGKVKLEVTIDATGHVTAVRVLSGLGFGLDEAALAAVKQYTFSPATKCGRPLPTTLKMGISFGLK